MKKKKSELKEVLELIEYKRESLLERRENLFTYVYNKLEEEDLHGAIDGLMDMRDIDSELKQIDSMKRICESL